MRRMYDIRRHLTTLCAAAGLALFAAPAQAWVESEVRSHVATVDVDRAGQAIVTHPGEWVQYSTPVEEGAEYLAVCVPAYALEFAHRDGGPEHAA